MKKFFSIFILTFLILITACKSAKTTEQDFFDFTEPQTQTEQVQKQGYELIKHPGTMLWEIDGYTQNGEPTKVYFLGTYHAGDGRIDAYPECVAAALEESDRFCCEISSDEWAALPDMMNNLTMQSFLKDFSHTLIDDLSQEEISLISKYIDSQTFASLVCFEPWVVNNYLQSIVMMASGLDPQKAYDIMIMNDILTNRPGTKIDGLDDVQVQLDLTAYGDWNTQMIMLRDTLADLEKLTEAVQEMTDLYEIFLTGDEQLFEEMYFKDINTEVLTQPVCRDYIKALLDERNKNWAQKVTDYLDMPGTTFIFAGCAHFVGPNSVFSYLPQLQ
ncbi:MAG: TraB/GumN family protein [Treponema sp.]|nr:TraB/GumN family protein [Treponema sp.]